MCCVSVCVRIGCVKVVCVGLECVGKGCVGVECIGLHRVFVSPAWSCSLVLGLVSPPVVGELVLSLLGFVYCLDFPASVSRPSVFCTFRLPYGLCSIPLWLWDSGVPGAST